MHRNTIRTTTLSWQTPRMPFLSSFCLCFLQNKQKHLTCKAQELQLAASFLKVARQDFCLHKRSRQCFCRYTDQRAQLTDYSGAAEAEHNNRKFWVIGSILRSDPQLFDWFSFNWLSSATWHHQSFRLEVREMKWLYNTISMIRHVHSRNILKCDRNHRVVTMLLS